MHLEIEASRSDMILLKETYPSDPDRVRELMTEPIRCVSFFATIFFISNFLDIYIQSALSGILKLFYLYIGHTKSFK